MNGDAHSSNNNEFISLEFYIFGQKKNQKIVNMNISKFAKSTNFVSSFSDLSFNPITLKGKYFAP